MAMVSIAHQAAAALRCNASSNSHVSHVLLLFGCFLLPHPSSENLFKRRHQAFWLNLLCKDSSLLSLSSKQTSSASWMLWWVVLEEFCGVESPLLNLRIWGYGEFMQFAFFDLSLSRQCSFLRELSPFFVFHLGKRLGYVGFLPFLPLSMIGVFYFVQEWNVQTSWVFSSCEYIFSSTCVT